MLQGPEFGEFLRRRADALGVSQSELAKAAGVTPQAVTGWFNKGRIGRKSLQAIAPLLESSVDDLLNGRDEAQTRVTEASPRYNGNDIQTLLEQLRDAFAIATKDNRDAALLMLGPWLMNGNRGALRSLVTMLGEVVTDEQYEERVPASATKADRMTVKVKSDKPPELF